MTRGWWGIYIAKSGGVSGDKGEETEEVRTGLGR